MNIESGKSDDAWPAPRVRFESAEPSSPRSAFSSAISSAAVPSAPSMHSGWAQPRYAPLSVAYFSSGRHVLSS